MSRVAKKEEGKIGSVCGKDDHQQNSGVNASGIRRCRCGYCGRIYTLNPKQITYDEKTIEFVIKIYNSGVIGRQAGKIFHMNKANVYNWIKR